MNAEAQPCAPRNWPSREAFAHRSGVQGGSRPAPIPFRGHWKTRDQLPRAAGPLLRDERCVRGIATSRQLGVEKARPCSKRRRNGWRLGRSPWAWLGANPSPSPIPAPATAEMHASRIEPVATAAHPVAREPSTPETPVVSSAAPDGGSPASSELQPSPPSNADAGAPAPSPPQPTVVGLGKALVRGNPLPAQLQATPDSGTVVVRGNKPPSALQTVSDSGVAVVRGHQASSSTRQAVVDGATEVVRGNRAPSGPSFSTVALPFDHPPSSHPDQE